MSKKLIKELSDKETFKSVFLVGEKQLLKDKKGSDYLNMYVSDKSGSLNARMWDKVGDCSDKFGTGDFVEIKGHIQVYQNRKQIVIHDLKKVEMNSVNLAEFLPSTQRDVAQMFDELKTIIKTIDDKFIKELLTLVLGDPEIQERFLRAPAAKSIHHAVVGGLLEHILSICGIMNYLANHYTFLNRDLLIFGAIFHDIGKTFEFEIAQGIQYSNEGRLVGHMAIANGFIDKFSTEIDGFPADLKDCLKHIVLSHHGRLEYGSPKRPKFLEAVVVAMVDELDSRMDSIKSIMENELDGGGEWTSYVPQYERYFYLKFLREKLEK